MDFETLVNMGIGNIGAIIGICILTAIVAIIGKVNGHLIVNLLIKIKRVFHRKGYNIADTIECDKLINQELSRFLFKSNGSRVGLFQFQNGSTFANNNPIWKISATHEQCELGTTQESMNVQSIPSALFTPLISPLFIGTGSDGVEPVLSLNSTSEYKLKYDISIFKIDPEEVKNNYIKNLLIGRGTKFGIIAPLLDWDDAIVGFILLEYCHNGFLTKDQLTEYCELAYQTSSRVFQVLCSVKFKRKECKKCNPN